MDMIRKKKYTATDDKIQERNPELGSVHLNVKIDLIIITTWSLSISPKMKTIHLLTRNVQIIAQSWINIWCGIP